MVVNQGEGFKVFLLDTKTGRINARPSSEKRKFTLKLNDAGSLSVGIPALAQENAGLNWRSLVEEKKQSLGISYNRQILECGPIWQSEWDAETQLLTITAAGLWTIFDKRKNLNWTQLLAGTSAPASSIVLNNKSLLSIARELVRISIQDNPVGGLNIVLPDDVPGTSSYTYSGFNLEWLGDVLRKLTTAEGGPDLRFLPRFNATNPNTVEWVLQAGTPTQPLLLQTGQDWYWDGTVPQSSVVGFNSKKDGTGMGDRAWVPGSGQEANMMISSAVTTSQTDVGAPYTEIDSQSKTVEVQATLDGNARRALADGASPILTFTITVRADAGPLLGTYRPGDMATVKIPRNHPHLPPGPMRVRLMAIDGDDTMNVKITCAPLLAGLGGGAYADRITRSP